MPRDDPDRQPFYLIVADYDRSVFAVEGLRTTGCGSLPLGPQPSAQGRLRPALTATSWQPSFAVNTRLAGVPPGSIVTPPP